jgi:hypothetical protein
MFSYYWKFVRMLKLTFSETSAKRNPFKKPRKRINSGKRRHYTAAERSNVCSPRLWVISTKEQGIVNVSRVRLIFAGSRLITRHGYRKRIFTVFITKKTCFPGFWPPTSTVDFIFYGGDISFGRYCGWQSSNNCLTMRKFFVEIETLFEKLPFGI